MPGTSTEQVVDKGIRQKSTKEWTHSLTAVPFVRVHRSVFPRTPRNTVVYTRHPTFVTATSAVLTRLLEKLSKNGMRVYTLSDRQSEKKLRVYTASEAKALIIFCLLLYKHPNGLFMNLFCMLQCGNVALNWLYFIFCVWPDKWRPGRAATEA